VVIDGDWTADEMASFYRACDDLYNLHAFAFAGMHPRLRSLFDEPIEFLLHRHPWLWSLVLRDPIGEAPNLRGDYLTRTSAIVRALISEKPFDVRIRLSPLRVKAEKYGSEGFKDLAGVGEAIKQLKEFIFGIIDYCLNYRKKQAEIEKAQLENEEKRKHIEQLELENRKRRVELVD
jgi:hypothetical protein